MCHSKWTTGGIVLGVDILLQSDYRHTPNATSVVTPSCVNVHNEKVIICRFVEISLQDSSNH